MSSNENGGYFGIEVFVKHWSGIAYSINKQQAKHLAARQILNRIIDDNEFLKFGIPAKTLDEAKKFVANLMPEIENGEIQIGKTQNFVGKLNELCAIHRLSPPTYDFFEVDKTPHDPKFRCEATLGEISASGVAKKKKDAKNLAAAGLYQLASSKFQDKNPSAGKGDTKSSESNNDDNPYELTLPPEPDYDDPNENLTISANEKYSTVQIARILAQINQRKIYDGCEGILLLFLNCHDPQIEKVFLEPTIDFQPTCSDGSDGGNVQVYLEIVSTFPNAADKKPSQQRNVFGGQGESEQKARDHAAWQALQYIYYFADLNLPPFTNSGS